VYSLVLKSKIKILMTGAGAPGGPGIIKCLKQDSRIDLVVGDMDCNASGKYLADSFIQLPSAKDDSFIEHVLDICIQNNIEMIFPLVTMELFKFSKSIKLFKKHNIHVVVSDFDSLSIANDKIALYQHLDINGIVVPDYRVAKNNDDLFNAIHELGYPEKPIAIKPGIANGSRGVRIINDGIDRFDLMFNYKPNNLYLSLSELKSILKNKEIPDMLVSEFLPGPELTIDTVVNSKHELEIALIRTRDKMNNGISVAGRFIESGHVKKYCSEIINSMKLMGPIGIQVKESCDGEFKIIEMNPRIQGTSVAALGLGINLPMHSISSILNWKVDPIIKSSGVGFARFYDEVYFESN